MQMSSFGELYLAQLARAELIPSLRSSQMKKLTVILKMTVNLRNSPASYQPHRPDHHDRASDRH